MKLSIQIRNWLMIGFEQPIGSINEDFHYDRKNNEFFSIVLTDQFMLNLNWNLASNVTTTYSKKQETSLIDRIRRIEFKDPEILSIDRISLEERTEVMQQFVDKLTNPKLIKVLQQRIYNQDYKTKFDFYFGNEANDLIKQKWEECKAAFLQQKVDTFLILNNIDIETATLWDVEADGSISLDLAKNDEEQYRNTAEITKSKKPWWRFL